MPEHSWGNGSTRPSDTTQTRVLESDLSVGDADGRDAVEVDGQAVLADLDGRRVPAGSKTRRFPAVAADRVRGRAAESALARRLSGHGFLRG